MPHDKLGDDGKRSRQHVGDDWRLTVDGEGAAYLTRTLPPQMSEIVLGIRPDDLAAAPAPALRDSQIVHTSTSPSWSSPTWSYGVHTSASRWLPHP